MAEVVYLLCALTSIACSVLLMKNYFRGRVSLILWTSACFIMLALNNVLLFIDLAILTAHPDLSLTRNVVGLAGVCLLLYGMISQPA